MSEQTSRDDLLERLRRVESGSPRGEFTTNWHRNPDGPEAADRIERLEVNLRTVQNAATTLHRARDTELAHLRENAAFDQRLRQEHQSLMDRDALMTDALLDAEARALAAEAEVARLQVACSRQNEEICQALGKALGYPWFKDDPANFPDATEEHGVCVGDHVAESLADEAAKRIERLERALLETRQPARECYGCVNPNNACARCKPRLARLENTHDPR